jgi:KaiC/GvpD/RAD55 family RecA-like ATPase
VTLVAGSAGAGKTLLGLNFLVAGARHYGEPGVLMTFEESAAKVALNVRSLGFDLDEPQRSGLLAVLAFRIDPSEIVAAGEFDLEPLFAIRYDAIRGWAPSASCWTPSRCCSARSATTSSCGRSSAG